ncbi:MAG: hypothetical protein K2W94_02910 [Alphaproteobacteria bacterium]|nr:hypothetical protein [Alphaproteobacteria bacterium]
MTSKFWDRKTIGLITLILMLLGIVTIQNIATIWNADSNYWNKAGIVIQALQLVILVMAAILTYRGWQEDREKDRENTRNNMRLQYLSDAYILIADFVQRNPLNAEEFKKHAQNIEKAADLINLFGTEEEITEFEKFALDASIPNKQANLDRILQMLRNRLRKELSLPEIMHPPRGVRYNLIQPIPSSQQTNKPEADQQKSQG